MRDTFAAAKGGDIHAQAVVQRYARFVAFRRIKARNSRMFAEMMVCLSFVGHVTCDRLSLIDHMLLLQHSTTFYGLTHLMLIVPPVVYSPWV